MPIPPGLRPTSVTDPRDTDSVVLIYQPGYRNPHNPTGIPPGRLYELEGASALLDSNGRAILDSQGRERWSAPQAASGPSA